ncbi:hypothetical protein QYE76_051153 [Lolium multiflorum]|uniref:Uncharacterized protein n=1 Tax=Lolium multiflorum TaxID=4521 RepID=A0AAD8WHX8_LOLMU|nr:hypothetical protein QYE76_051153 [Lolium multiflorum]
MEWAPYHHHRREYRAADLGHVVDIPIKYPQHQRPRESPNATRPQKLEKEKKRLKLIDTSNQNQPNIHQFFMTSAKNPGTKPPRNPKKKAKPSPATMPVTPQAEAPPKPSSSAVLCKERSVIQIKDDAEQADSGKGASSSKPVADELTIKIFQDRLKTSQELLAKRPSVDDISAQLKTPQVKHESLQATHKESQLNETILKKKLETKHEPAMSELREKLKISDNRVKTLASKLKSSEAEAVAIDKIIFPLLGFERRQDDKLTRAGKLMSMSEMPSKT